MGLRDSSGRLENLTLQQVQERGVNPTSAYGCGGTCGGWFGGGWGRCNKGCKCRGGLCVSRNRREEEAGLDVTF